MSTIDHGGAAAAAVLLRPATRRHLADQLTARAEPIVELEHRAWVAVELLASFRTPALAVGRSLADELAELERAGDIERVTDEMLEMASMSSHDVDAMHVNISARDLDDARLPRRVEAHWRFSAWHRLVLEVTEHVPVAPGQRLRSNLGWLARNGVGVAADDFGEGHCDRRSVELLEPEIIKVSTVRFGRCDAWEAPVVDLLHQIAAEASSLAPTTVVEGIETRAQHDVARSCGFDLGQGRLYGS